MCRNSKDSSTSGKKEKTEHRQMDRRALAAQQVWHCQRFLTDRDTSVTIFCGETALCF